MVGQEEGDVGIEEGITITPFNMKEELEEGHFDKDGTYIFAKEVGSKSYSILEFFFFFFFFSEQCLIRKHVHEMYTPLNPTFI